MGDFNLFIIFTFNCKYVHVKPYYGAYVVLNYPLHLH